MSIEPPKLPTMPSSTLPVVVNEQVQIVQNRDRDRLIWCSQRPRDMAQVLEKVLTACKRESFAQIAVWERPIDGKPTKGPGIRLAELIAKYYGNFDSGTRIVKDQSNDKQTTVQVYAWDLETNYGFSTEITIEHKQPGKNKPYLDSTDAIYKIVAAHTSRKLRDAIFKVVDADIKDLAYEQCLKTNAKVTDLKPVLEKVELRFTELGVNREQLEAYIGKKFLDFTQEDIGQLRAAFNEIQEGTMSVDDIKGYQKAAEPPKETKAKPETEQPVDVQSEPVVVDNAAAQAVEAVFS